MMGFLKRHRNAFKAYKNTDSYKADEYQNKTKLKFIIVLFPLGALLLWAVRKYLEWNSPYIMYALLAFCVIGANYGAYILRRKKFND